MNTKKSLLLIGFSFILSFVMAQDPSLPIYMRFPSVPPFKIIKLPDSSFFKKDDLRKKKATLIMIFSPDCDHCQKATKGLIANAGLFKKIQIVMGSSASYESISHFYRDFAIAGQSNIIMGWDPGFFLGSFYSITTFPSIFLYNKKGVYVQKFEGHVPFTKIAEQL